MAATTGRIAGVEHQKAFILGLLASLAPSDHEQREAAIKTREIFQVVSAAIQAMPSEEELAALTANLKKLAHALPSAQGIDQSTESKAPGGEKGAIEKEKLFLIHARTAFDLKDYSKASKLALKGLEICPERTLIRADLYLTRAHALAAMTYDNPGDAYKQAKEVLSDALGESFENKDKMRLLSAQGIIFICHRDNLTENFEKEKKMALLALNAAIVFAEAKEDETLADLQGLRESILEETNWEIIEKAEGDSRRGVGSSPSVTGQVISYAGHAMSAVSDAFEQNELLFKGLKLLVKLAL
ncbi:MAG: hypothetical protein KR126chlam1_01368 [Chlamydiae bacterium]|nr:hypothetical protein [Chlamydiota bacterium]